MGTITHMSKPYIKIVGLTENEKRDISVAAASAGMSLSSFCWKALRLVLLENTPQSIKRWSGKVESYPPKLIERKERAK
jgi:hypothetical protein